MKQQKLIAAILCAVTPLSYAADDKLDEIVVTATRIAQPLKQSLSSTTVITQQEIQASQSVDVASVLKNLAGVEIYQSGGVGKQSSLFLRGTNSSHTLVLVDGVRINSATTGTTAIDQLMLDQIERIEIVRGNVSSLYGSEAIGGVIQIFTKHGKGEPVFNAGGGVGSYNTQRVSAGFGGEASGTGFNIQLSKFRTTGVSSIKQSILPTVNPDKDGYTNTGISLNIRHSFGTEHSFSASLFDSEGKNHTDNSSSSGLPSDLNTSKSHIQKLALVSENHFSRTWQSKLQLAQGMDDSQSFLNGVPNTALGAQFKTINEQVSWENILQIDKYNALHLGLESLHQRVTSDTAYTQKNRTANSLLAGYIGSIGLHQIQLNWRQDRYSDFGAANTSLVGYGYEISDAWRATASVSSAFKAPTLNDLFYPFTNYGGGYSYQGNRYLKPEHSRNTEFGLHYVANSNRLDVTYFDNKIRDLIVNDNKMASTMVNLNQARSDGLEVSYAGQFSDTGVKAALTFQNPRDTQTGLVLLRRAKSFANIGVAQQFNAWKVAGEWQYSNTREDIDINTYARTTLGSYNLFNLTASYDISKQLKLSLRADNLFNEDYMLAHGYNTLKRTLFVGVNYQH